MLTQPRAKAINCHGYMFVSVCVDSNNDSGSAQAVGICHGSLLMLDGISSSRPESGQDCEGAYGHAPCILVLVWDNHFTQADWGAADRLLLGHRRPSHSDGRRTHPEESPNSCLGQPSPHLARTGQSFTQEV